MIENVAELECQQKMNDNDSQEACKEMTPELQAELFRLEAGFEFKLMSWFELS